MKLLLTATNRPDAPKKGLPRYGKHVRYDADSKRWTSEAWGSKGGKVTFHPVDVGQGVC